MGKFRAKPKALVNNKDKSLSTHWTGVSSCTGNDWHILFAIGAVGVIWSNVTDSSGEGQRYKITAESTCVGVSIKFTAGKNRININGRHSTDRGIKLETAIERLVGRKQTVRKYVSRARRQSAAGFLLGCTLFSAKSIASLLVGIFNRYLRNSCGWRSH